MENEDVTKKVSNGQNESKKNPQESADAPSLPENKLVYDLTTVEAKPRKTIVIPQGDDITLEQWQELAKKEPSLLTALERKQLEETNKMFADVLKGLDLSVAFSAVRSIEPLMSSFARLNNDALVFSKAVASAQLAITPHLDSLVTLQKTIAAHNEGMAKALANIASASLVASSMFEGFQSYHARIIKSLQVDIPTLVKPTWSGLGQIIEFDTPIITEQDGHIFTSSSTRQVREHEGYVLISEAKLDLLFTELRANRAELAEFKRLLHSGIPEGASKVEYADATFKREESVLVIKGYKVPINKNAKQAKFCEAFFRSATDFVRKWDIEELMLAAFGERLGIDADESVMINRIKGYVTALNIKIAAATKGQIVDFFVLFELDVYINRKYLSNL